MRLSAAYWCYIVPIVALLFWFPLTTATTTIKTMVAVTGIAMIMTMIIMMVMVTIMMNIIIIIIVVVVLVIVIVITITIIIMIMIMIMIQPTKRVQWEKRHDNTITKIKGSHICSAPHSAASSFKSDQIYKQVHLSPFGACYNIEAFRVLKV